MTDAPGESPRFSTRDLIVPTLFFLGALLLAAAFAMGPIVGSGLKKLPLTIDRTWVADGSDGTLVLDRCSLERPTAQVLEADVQQRQRSVAVRPADSNVVTVQAGTALGVDTYVLGGKSVDAKDVCAEPTLVATIDRVTLGRQSASPTGQSSIQYDDKRAAVDVPNRTGRTYVLPYGWAAPGDYFDVPTRTTVPLHDLGGMSIDGRDVRRLQAQIPETDLGAAGTDPRGVIRRPASWFGQFPGVAPNTELTAVLHYQSTRDLYVDERTGVVIDQRVDITESYRFTADEVAKYPALRDFALTNLRTVLTGDRQSRIDGANEARDRARPVLLATRVLPVASGTLGALLLLCGLVLVVRSSRKSAHRTAP
ncbi:porin PorA family protein [Gordonia sp. (in: high G+C Gram-positive bacteria)]|uniref:porin PorA family protein n=1 Tax=Gordonia sp. (in: high G+C Gram-positive bacteria) TaxID=84139 RepID=UPI003C73DFA5